MPLSPWRSQAYAEGRTTTRANLASRGGCESVLATTTVLPDGTIAACCGLPVRLIPELHLGNVRDTTLADTNEEARKRFLIRWLRSERPDRILVWAATH